MNNNFAFNLKHIRQEKGLTQEQLGKLMDKDYSTIGKWENGTRSPIMEDLLKLSEVLNVDIKDLIDKDYSSSTNIDMLSQYRFLFDKDNALTDEQKKFIIEFLEDKHKKVDNNENIND